jgi:hypothetical protein
MEFIYDFTEQVLKEIVKRALEEGYEIRITEWMDEWEREEGCQSVCFNISKEEFYEEYEGSINAILPECTKHGCGELNLTKENDYICCYHVEYTEEYICRESLDFIDLDNLENWIEEEIIELIDNTQTRYLHGNCQDWVKTHFKEGDKALVSLELNEETGTNYLIHCCIIRDGSYIDVRGITDDFDYVLEGFDYYNHEKFEFDNLEDFIKFINNLGVDFEK